MTRSYITNCKKATKFLLFFLEKRKNEKMHKILMKKFFEKKKFVKMLLMKLRQVWAIFTKLFFVQKLQMDQIS